MIAATSAPITNIPERIALTLFFVGLIALAVWGIRLGWKRKVKLQSDIAPPHPLPENMVAEMTISGRFLATTAAGAWLSRITVHTLGVPSRCDAIVGTQGLAFVRQGALSFFVPWHEVIAVRVDRAIAGRAFEKDGIAVITWKLGDIFVESGFRADSIEEHLQFIETTQQQVA